MTLAERVRKFREDSGFSQLDLARAAGLSSAYIGKIERGDVNRPSYDTLQRIARAMNRSTSELSGEEIEDQELSDSQAEWRDLTLRLPPGELQVLTDFLRAYITLPDSIRYKIVDLMVDLAEHESAHSTSHKKSNAEDEAPQAYGFNRRMQDPPTRMRILGTDPNEE